MKGFAPFFMTLSKHRLPAQWLEAEIVLLCKYQQS